MSKLLSAPYIGSPIVPDTVEETEQESINILMGDGQLELDALVEIVLKKPYNGSGGFHNPYLKIETSNLRYCWKTTAITTVTQKNQEFKKT